MNKVKVILTIILCFLFAGNCFTQVSKNYSKLDFSQKVIEQKSSVGISEKFNASVQTNPNQKSPLLGALFSGVLPGAGEFYSKSYLKAAIFLAIEAGLWTGYSIFQKKGNDQTDKFQGYANQNWSLNKYAQWLVEQQFAGYGAITNSQSTNLEQLRREINIVEGQNFSHQLPPIGEQQYYELIGKYQNFVPGWMDADLSRVNRNNYGGYTTTMFISYSFDRQEANDYYNKGTTALTVIILNHILSAADAAWSVSMFNKSLKVRTGIKLENKYSGTGEKKLLPVASFNVTF
ncbi:MAG: hypothetical protein SGI89_08420 [bacterium]|nr:hypothetical protein [bacterium]